MSLTLYDTKTGVYVGPATSPIRTGGASGFVSDSDSDDGPEFAVGSSPSVLPPIPGASASTVRPHPALNLASNPYAKGSLSTSVKSLNAKVKRAGKTALKRAQSERRVRRNPSLSSKPPSLAVPSATQPLVREKTTLSALATVSTLAEQIRDERSWRRSVVHASALQYSEAKEEDVRRELADRAKEWDAHQAAVVRANKQIRREQKAVLRTLKQDQERHLREMAAAKPAKAILDPRRIFASTMMSVLRPVADDWRRGNLEAGWMLWRSFTVEHRRTEAELGARATALQAVYRGYRTRKAKKDAPEETAKMSGAARIVTRFIRLVGQIRAEEQARDMERRAIQIQRALRENQKGKATRAELRQRILAGLAVIGRGNASKVVRAVGWGTYGPVGAGGEGIFKEPWTTVGAALAGVSRVLPREAALPPEAKDRIRSYLGPAASLGDCFVLARSLAALDERGTKGPGGYTLLELTRAVKQLEQLVEAIQEQRRLKAEEIAARRRRK